MISTFVSFINLNLKSAAYPSKSYCKSIMYWNQSCKTFGVCVYILYLETELSAIFLNSRSATWDVGSINISFTVLCYVIFD